MKMKRTLNAMVKNGPETLMRITGLMRKKGCKLEGLVYEVGKLDAYSKLTLTVGAPSDELVDNMILQMRRFQDVYEVSE